MFVATDHANESQPSINTSSTIYTSSAIYNAFPKPFLEQQPFPVQWSQPCRLFEYHEILSATQNFDASLVIGTGGFGNVYKGNLVVGSSSVVAAIKRSNLKSRQGALEFRAEVEILSKVRHNHLVPLIGYCAYGKEMLLVYEYMPNGTLYDHLHEHRSPLFWHQRLRICISAARALEYLHIGTGIEFGIIHQDVKSCNILFDKSWAAKISDFGLSKLVQGDQKSTYVSTLVKGTLGYMDPNYFSTGKLTRKSDVYSFGVVLLEVLCRKKAMDESLDWGLATWAQDLIREGRLKDIIDFDIRDKISQKGLRSFVQIAERCLDNKPRHRPTMTEVVSALEFVLNLQEKSSNSLQAGGKSLFGRWADRFLITANDKNSGMEFEFCMPGKRKLLMLRKKILQQNGALSCKKVSIRILQLKPNFFGSIKIFKAKELEEATNGYAEDRILGRGGQGIVYKGILPNKRVVAIKILRIFGQSRLEQFITEIIILEQINHKNVVQLLGCCFKTESVLLVYEFISKGTLRNLIDNETSSTRTLSWDSRLRIAHESADALAYLHTYATMSIVHRDVKSTNILLDENYTAKLSDFGSSSLIPLNYGKIFTEVEGTLGYMDPEYFDTHQLTCKTDVYGFGVVLAELLTGKKPIDRKRGDDDIRLSTYFVKETKENRVLKTLDPQVIEEATSEQLCVVCHLIQRCLDQLSGSRPSMKEVTMELEKLRNWGKHPTIQSLLNLQEKIVSTSN